MSELGTLDTTPLWKAIEAVIKEAEGRYGLILFGRVTNWHNGDLVLQWTGSYGDFSVAFSREHILTSRGEIPEYLIVETAGKLREIAEERDRERRERNA